MSPLVRDQQSAMGSYAHIEAGQEMRGPSPARRMTFPLRMLRMKPVIFAGVAAAARWVAIIAVVGGALMIGDGLRGG